MDAVQSVSTILESGAKDVFILFLLESNCCGNSQKCVGCGPTWVGILHCQPVRRLGGQRLQQHLKKDPQIQHAASNSVVCRALVLSLRVFYARPDDPGAEVVASRLDVRHKRINHLRPLRRRRDSEP